MRVVTAFKRMLRLDGWASVTDVSFDSKGVIVTVKLAERRRRICSVCGQTGRHLEIVDYRTKRWRHLDLGVNRCLLECELRRLRCPDCGVRYEAVRWARPGSPCTRDFEDVVAFLAQQMAKTPLRRLMRIAWDSVGDIVTRVVADHFSEARFFGLVLIGVDEIAYRRGQRYLTCVADHERGAIVWAKPGRDAKTLQAFFELLGDRRHTIKAISIDMSAGYENAITAVAEQDPQFTPEVVFDPFHVCQLASRAVDDVRRAEWNEHGKSNTPGGRWIKHARWSLLKAPERQTEQQLARLAEVAATNKRLYRAFLLKEELRLLYHGRLGTRPVATPGRQRYPGRRGPDGSPPTAAARTPTACGSGRPSASGWPTAPACRSRSAISRLAPANGTKSNIAGLFSFTSLNWRGKSLESHEVSINLIAATTTSTGLKVYAQLDKRPYPPRSKSPTNSSVPSTSPGTRSTVTGAAVRPSVIES